MHTNESLIEHLIVTKALRSKEIISAFRAIDRKHFVPKQFLEQTYEDHPLPLAPGATISQPTTVAMLLEWLEPKPGEKILDVGSGSGWTSCLLSRIVGPTGIVYGIDILPQLVHEAKHAAMQLGITNAHFSVAGKKLGESKHAPYDRILVNAAARTIPTELLQQLKNGGIMVVPVNDAVVLVRKESATKHSERYYHGFAFVPLQ